MIRHPERDLALADDHVVGAEAAEVVRLFVRMGARDDQQRRVRLPRLLDRLPRLEGIGDGDEEVLRPRDVGERQRLPACADCPRPPRSPRARASPRRSSASSMTTNGCPAAASRSATTRPTRP